MSPLGERLKALRLREGISQKELAERANVHQTEISFLERGERRLRFDMALKLAGIFGVTVNDFAPSDEDLADEQQPVPTP